MTEADVEIIRWRVREKFPEASSKVITDNGPQIVARNCKEFIRVSGRCHVARPFHRQSNGQSERPKMPLSLEDAKMLVSRFVDYYNQVRPHRTVGCIAPADKLDGRESDLFAGRERKPAATRENRRINHRALKSAKSQ